MGDALAPEKGMSVAGLAREWERCESIRERLREEGAVLFTKDMEPTVKNSCLPWIHDYLKTCLYRMAEGTSRPQPLVEPLRDEITFVYQTMSKQVQDDQVVLDSWQTRKFLGFIKMKTRKELPSTDTCLC